MNTGTVTAASPVFVIPGPFSLPANVWVTPASGSTVTVASSIDSGVTWTNWPPGTVSVHTEQGMLTQKGQLRFTLSSGTSAAWGIA